MKQRIEIGFIAAIVDGELRWEAAGQDGFDWQGQAANVYDAFTDACPGLDVAAIRSCVITAEVEMPDLENPERVEGEAREVDDES